MPPTPREKKKAPDKKVYWRKTSGFHAFNDKPMSRENKGEPVICNPIAPETGIHSQAWADAIALQVNSRLFSTKLNTEIPGKIRLIPGEIRLKIWELVIKSSLKDSEGNTIYIQPQKWGMNFEGCNIQGGYYARVTGSLYHICRQAYVDTCVSGLFYKLAEFQFSSPRAMMNYVSVINPNHKDAIRTLSLHFSLTSGSTSLRPKIAFETLSSMKSLRSLAIHIGLVAALGEVVADQDGRKNWRVTERILDKIKKCKGWAMIKDLQEFNLSIVGYEQVWVEAEDDRSKVVAKEIRDAVLGNKTKSITSGSR